MAMGVWNPEDDFPPGMPEELKKLLTPLREAFKGMAIEGKLDQTGAPDPEALKRRIDETLNHNDMLQRLTEDPKGLSGKNIPKAKLREKLDQVLTHWTRHKFDLMSDKPAFETGTLVRRPVWTHKHTKNWGVGVVLQCIPRRHAQVHQCDEPACYKNGFPEDTLVAWVDHTGNPFFYWTTSWSIEPVPEGYFDEPVAADIAEGK